jgi:hypothetical protein
VSGLRITGGAIGRFLLIVLIFVLLGPPVGAVTFVGMLTLGFAADTGNPEGAMWVGIFLLIYGLFLSWFIGFVPALIAGALVGVRQAFFGPVPFWMAGLIGLVVGLGAHAGSGDVLVPWNDGSYALFVPLCLVPTLACWLAAKLVGSASPLSAPPDHGSPAQPDVTPGGWNR